jgi:endonuclease/exonuclease/phosphatase (EEP) superfamily protein YafD
MHDERRAASRGDAFDEVGQRGVLVLLVDADAAFHGDFDARSATASRIAATHSATSAGSRMRQAPKRPDCTRSDGQPTLRLISS